MLSEAQKAQYQANRELSGIRRFKRGSLEEKQQAVEMCKTLPVKQVAEILARPATTIYRWINPEQQQKEVERSRRWYQKNPEQGKAKSRRYVTFPHGRENARKCAARRRSLQFEALFPVLVDGVWHEVDMFDYLESDIDAQMFVDDDSCIAYAQMVECCKQLEVLHGEKFHVDHLIPLSAGGLHHYTNFQIKPASVNLSKNNKRLPVDDALFASRIFDLSTTK